MSFCGTLAWIAPEALLREPSGTKVDDDSIGVIMMEFITRREPYT